METLVISTEGNDSAKAATINHQSGIEMLDLCTRLYPIGRSITGDGVRKTLALLADIVDLQVVEIPSGTAVFDWVVPQEWNIADAYVANAQGERVIDFKEHTLHVVSYSEPVQTRLSLSELEQHLFSLPDFPDWIPYRTAYYDRSWGFCLQDRARKALEPGDYDVVINSTLSKGALSYGEYVIPGASEEELLISTHICHPSLANDNLSGIAVATHLARYFASRQGALHYSLRFVFIPGTIGSITWLATNQKRLSRIVGGVVLTGVGDGGAITFKRSRSGAALIDRVFESTLQEQGTEYTVRSFEPYGYDERQYCSPGIDLPVACLMRTPFGQYPEYHTSGDNLDFIRADSLRETFELCVQSITEFQKIRAYRNLSPNCEPQLGRRGLYEAIGGDNDKSTAQLALLWMLNYSDGGHTTLDISNMSRLSLTVLDRAAGHLVAADLLAPLSLEGFAHGRNSAGGRSDYVAD